MIPLVFCLSVSCGLPPQPFSDYFVSTVLSFGMNFDSDPFVLPLVPDLDLGKTVDT